MNNENETTTLDDDGIVDAKNFEQAERGNADALEKDQREAAKESAKKAKKGEFIVTRDLRCDGKKFKRGDEFEGKLYANLTDGRNPALVTKKAWSDR